jgi:hypothetical protein
MYKSIPANSPAQPGATHQRLPAPIAAPPSVDEQVIAVSGPTTFGTAIHFLAGVGFDAIGSQFSMPSAARA